MQITEEKASELLKSLNDSLVKQSVTQSNQVFGVARVVEKLGESIASRITNFSTVIAVNSSSLGEYFYTTKWEISAISLA